MAWGTAVAQVPFLAQKLPQAASKTKKRKKKKKEKRKEKKKKDSIFDVAQWKQIWLVFMRMQVKSLALLSRSGIQHCCELRCRLAATANSTPGLGTSTCRGCGPKKQKPTNKTHCHCLAV